MRFLISAVLLISLFGAGSAVAQVEAVLPPNPTSADNIVLRIGTYQTQMVLQPVVISGSAINIIFRGGSEFPTTDTHFVTLGQLPAGEYSVVVTFQFTGGGDVVLSTVTLAPFPLVVAAAIPPVPFLGVPALVVLTVALALAATFALKA